MKTGIGGQTLCEIVFWTAASNLAAENTSEELRTTKSVMQS